MDSLLAKLKLDNHHKIERFGVLFLSLLCCMGIVLSTIVVKASKDNSQTLTEQAKYTQSFAMSKSKVNGEVVDVYTNESHTKTFLLLKLDDTTGISTNALDYQMFLTGSSLDTSPSWLKINPTGSIYMFGTSGYIGVYLTDARGFDKQILQLIIRCNNDISVVGTGDSEQADQSFSKYDQCMIYFNPGGDNATVVSFLDAEGGIDVNALYEELITRPQEQNVKAILNTDVTKMVADIKTIQEYSRQLNAKGIVVNAAPTEILGDKIVDADGNLIASMNMSDWDVTSQATVGDDAVLSLKSNTVCDGGVYFDWRDGSIKEGYLKTVAPNVENVKQYLAGLGTTNHMMNTTLIWYQADGSEYVTGSDSSIDASIQNLIGAWNTYYSDKTNYECVDMPKLLQLEYEVSTFGSDFTVNDGETVLTNWQSK